MGWFEDLLNTAGSLVGLVPPPETELQPFVKKCTKQDTKIGYYKCFLHSQIVRSDVKAFLISFMRKKEFQAISTGPRTALFMQANSDRNFVCQFMNEKQGKIMEIKYREGETYVPDSPTDVFFQSILTEFSFDIAKLYFLRTQYYNPAKPAVENENLLKVWENSFIDSPNCKFVLFLRIHRHVEIANLIKLKALEHKLQHVQKGNNKELIFFNNETNQGLRVNLGYNDDTDLLMHAFFAPTDPIIAELINSNKIEAPKEQEVNVEGSPNQEVKAEQPETGEAQSLVTVEEILFKITEYLASSGLLRTDGFNNQFPSQMSIETQEFQKKGYVNFEIDDYLTFAGL